MTAMKAGASAYIVKSAPIVQLLAAIDFSVRSPLSFSAQGLAAALQAKSMSFELTARELDVLSRLANGASNKEIAASLFLTQATVKTHLASIFRKLNVSNRTAAVSKARKHSLIVE